MFGAFNTFGKLGASVGGRSLASQVTTLSPLSRPPGTTYKKRATGSSSGIAQIQSAGYTKDTATSSAFNTSNGVFKTSSASSIQIIAHGDSITDGSAASEGYVTRLVRSLYVASGIKADYKNRCIGGQGFTYVYNSSAYPNNLVDDAAAEVDAAMSGSLTNYLIVFAGTNDYKLGAKTPAQIRTAFQTYIAARIAAGWTASRICVCTMLPRETVNETDRSTINSNFTADAGTYGYTLAPLHLNASIGAAGQQNNTTYFLDTIHPTDAGQAIIASIIKGVLFP